MERQIRVGISGWTYAPWRGKFYPANLSHYKELAYAARKMNSIEINGTFYSLQSPASFEFWHEQTPDDFIFSVKAPRFITHILRLTRLEVPLANFFASGVLRLKRKLGPILWQLPPNFHYDALRIRAFLDMLPHDMYAAAALGRLHDDHLHGPAWLAADENLEVRHAVEVRNASFNNTEFFSMLKDHKVALVVADTAGKWPFLQEETADFAYARLHGDEKIYTSGYTPGALKAWAGKIRTWLRGGRDVFVYFDNDVKVRAPHDAMSLARLLGATSAGRVEA